MAAEAGNLGWATAIVAVADSVPVNTGHGIEISIGNTDLADGSNITNIAVKKLPGYTPQQLSVIGKSSNEMMRKVHKVHHKASPWTISLVAVAGVALVALGSAIGYSMKTANFNLFPQDNLNPQPSEPSFGSMAIVYTGIAAVTGTGAAIGTYCYNNWNRFTNWLFRAEQAVQQPAVAPQAAQQQQNA